MCVGVDVVGVIKAVKFWFYCTVRLLVLLYCDELNYFQHLILLCKTSLHNCVTHNVIRVEHGRSCGSSSLVGDY